MVCSPSCLRSCADINSIFTMLARKAWLNSCVPTRPFSLMNVLCCVAQNVVNFSEIPHGVPARLRYGMYVVITKLNICSTIAIINMYVIEICNCHAMMLWCYASVRSWAKFIHFRSRMWIWKCRLRSGGRLSRPQCVKRKEQQAWPLAVIIVNLGL